MRIFTVLLYVICRGRDVSGGCNEVFIAVEPTEELHSELLPIVERASGTECSAECHRRRECIGVMVNENECRLFASYTTQSSQINRSAGTRYLKLETKCDTGEDFWRREYWRDGSSMSRRVVCLGNNFLLGSATDGVQQCNQSTTAWTATTASCFSNALPIEISGTTMNAKDARLTIVASPTGVSFYVIIKDTNNNYLMKMYVRGDTKVIKRNIREDGSYSNSPETDLLSGFPFVVDQQFTLEITSTMTLFQCTVDGYQLFTFAHRLPRDSVATIEIGSELSVERVHVWEPTAGH